MGAQLEKDRQSLQKIDLKPANAAEALAELTHGTGETAFTKSVKNEREERRNKADERQSSPGLMGYALIAAVKSALRQDTEREGRLAEAGLSTLGNRPALTPLDNSAAVVAISQSNRSLSETERRGAGLSERSVLSGRYSGELFVNAQQFSDPKYLLGLGGLRSLFS